MVNLNECKLGDKLKMRNGELAIYVGKKLMVCASNRGVFIDQEPDNMLKQIKETRTKKHGWR